MSRSNDTTTHLNLLAHGHLPQPTSGPGPDLLEAFPNCYPHRPYVIQFSFAEFTSLCPVTGQPDFGRIEVAYIPDQLCVESKSFKLYMFAFREHHSFMETMTNKILDDLWSVLNPHWCRVLGLFAARGGTYISVLAEDFKSTNATLEKKVKDQVSRYISSLPLNSRQPL